MAQGPAISARPRHHTGVVRRSLVNRQADVDDKTAPGSGLGPHLAAVAVHDALDRREPDAGPLEIAGTVQAGTTTARKTTNRTDRKEILDSLTNFANRFICILRLELGLLPFRVWTHRLRLAKRLGGCTAR